jgi:hypothetical protein
MESQTVSLEGKSDCQTGGKVRRLDCDIGLTLLCMKGSMFGGICAGA